MKIFEFKTDYPCLTLKELAVNEGVIVGQNGRAIIHQNGFVTISQSEEIVIRQVDGLVQMFIRPISWDAK